MDFDSLQRRDLQFFCKRNKIPANMTNIAMADALKALEIVEGIDEFVNQSEPTYDQSPTSVAKNLPNGARTAARTTRRKATKDETQSSELVTRSCHVTSKSLAREMDQENRNENMLQNPSVPQSRGREAATSVAVKLDVTDIKPEATNLSKTPAARSTRRAQAAASSKKDESVQRVYSTRRAVKLLEESMADLSLKTKESLNVPAKKNEDSPAGRKYQAKPDEKSEKTEEPEVISVRDLNDSLEKEWDGSGNDPDLNILHGDITFSDANTSKEQMNGTESKTVPTSDSFVLVGEQETLQEDDFVVVDHAASTITISEACNEESESEQIKTDSESESEETGYGTDPSEDDDDSGIAVETNQDAFGSNVFASDNVSKLCGSDETEETLVSDKKKNTQTSSSSPLAEKKHESDSDEWSDTDFEIEENSCESEELTDSESEKPPLSDKKKTPASSSSSSAKKDFAAADDDNKNNENAVEIVLTNNGEGKAEAKKEKKKKKKKIIDEESFKDVSMRQLTKMVKELAFKSKQQHKCSE